jgi:hypothetical protein
VAEKGISFRSLSGATGFHYDHTSGMTVVVDNDESGGDIRLVAHADNADNAALLQEQRMPLFTAMRLKRDVDRYNTMGSNKLVVAFAPLTNGGYRLVVAGTRERRWPSLVVRDPRSGDVLAQANFDAYARGLPARTDVETYDAIVVTALECDHTHAYVAIGRRRLIGHNRAGPMEEFVGSVGGVYVVSLASGSIIALLESPGRDVMDAALHSAARLLATISVNGILHVWRLSKLGSSNAIPEHVTSVVAFGGSSSETNLKDLRVRWGPADLEEDAGRVRGDPSMNLALYVSSVTAQRMRVFSLQEVTTEATTAGRSGTSSDGNSIASSNKWLGMKEEMPCDECGRWCPTLKICSGCSRVWYCGKECQTLAWRSSHKALCQA